MLGIPVYKIESSENWLISIQFPCRQTALVQKFGELCQTVPATWPQQLYQAYQTSVKALLYERERAFLMNQSVQSYDYKHLSLIESTFQQIRGLNQMSITVSTAAPTCGTPNTPAYYKTPSPAVTPLNDSGYNSSQSTPNSLSPQPRSPAASDTTPVTFRAATRRGRFLNNVAVQLMEEWYRANFDHPYPTDAVVQQLAGLGNITTNQVKKWMANKRVRSCNTLSFNGSVHPKKLKRMQRHMALQSAVSAAAQGQLMDSRALSEFYTTHSNSPNSEDRRQLANKSGLSLPQVKAWFANKRSHDVRGVHQQSEYSLQVPADYFSHVNPSLPLL